MRIYIGADHRGVDFKKQIIEMVKNLGYAIEDCGAFSSESCDYPLMASKVTHEVIKGEDHRGILLCASGIGQSIAANKVNGIRAALCYNLEAAKLSREHNDANVLVISAMFTPEDQLEAILKVWLSTTFEGGRHQRRIDLIREMEKGKEL